MSACCQESVPRNLFGSAKIAPGVLALALPKCPMCFAAWASIFGTLGVDAESYAAYKPAVLLGLSLVTVVLMRKHPWRYWLVSLLFAWVMFRAGVTA